MTPWSIASLVTIESCGRRFLALCMRKESHIAEGVANQRYSSDFRAPGL